MTILLLCLLCVAIKLTKSNLGTTQQGPGSNNWIKYIPGDGPIIIVASHDGTDTPSSIVNRDEGCYASSTRTCIWEPVGNPCPSGSVRDENNCNVTDSRDTYTKDIASCLQNTATFQLTLNVNGVPTLHTFHPHYIFNNVKRIKIDTNREIGEGCLGNANCESAWNLFNTYINTARTSALSKCDFGIVLDIHGHAKNNYTMMGYDISETQQQSSAEIDDETQSTVYGLSQRNSVSIASIVHGNNSLGQLLNVIRTDYRVTPSYTYQDPFAVVGSNYFQGDYVVDTYGSANTATGKIDAIQIEISKWIRFSGTTKNTVEIANFCTHFSNAIINWIRHWHSTRYTACHL